MGAVTDEDDEKRAFALGMTYEGRSVPPDGWGLETMPGVAGAGIDLPFVRISSGALLPSIFVMQLTVPAPSSGVIRLIYKSHKDGVSITTVWAEGMDAVQAVDVLRRIAPIDVWNRLAVRDMGFRFAMMQLNAAADGIDVLTAKGMSEKDARLLLRAFSAEHGTWPTFQSGSAPRIPSDKPEWVEAGGEWRQQLESGSLGATINAMQTRPTVRRNRVTKEHLRQVAAVYRKAQEAGEPPTMAVAEAFQASHSTATRWVGLARNEGFLGPAQKGKSGEINDDESNR